MSNATDALRAAFRDYATDGVPATGPNDPEKPDIRAAFSTLGTELSSIGAGISRYATAASMNADTTGPAGELAYVYRNNGAADDPANGVYQRATLNGAWESAPWYFDAVAGVLQPLVDEAELAAGQATTALETSQALIDTISDEVPVTLSDRAISGGYTPSVFVKWSVGLESGDGLDAPDGSLVTALTVNISVASGTTNLEAQVVARDRSDPNYNESPGNATSDVVLFALSQSVTAAGITPGGGSAPVRWGLPIPLLLDPAKGYFLVFTANAGSKNLAPQITSPATGYNPLRRGWFFFSGGSADVLADGQAVALKLETTSREIRPSDKRLKSIATRTFCGERTEYPFDNATPKTFRMIMALARGFGAVRVLFASGETGPVNVARCAVGVIASPSNFAASGVTWVPAKFNGLEGAKIPPSAGSNRRGWLASDWIEIDSIPRSDDPDACPFVVASAYIDTADTLTLMGNSDGSHDYTGMATHPDRPVVMRYNDGDCVTTPGSFASTTNRSTSPIVGFQYRANGKVVTVGGVGDSITADPTGWLLRSCVELSNRAIAFESCNLAWAGSGPDTFGAQFTDTLDLAVYPDACFLPVWSPNTGVVPMTDDGIDFMREHATTTLHEVQSYGIRVIPWTGIPVNPSVHDYGASDSKRRDYNDEWRDLAGLGLTVADMGAAMAGTIDGDGQEQILAGNTTDGIHPNSTGNDTMRDVAAPSLAAAGVYTLGSLVT